MMAKKTADDLYSELEKIKILHLVSSIKYTSCGFSRNLRKETVDVNFNHAIPTEKVLQVYDYIKDTYGYENSLVEKIELKSSHCIRLAIVWTR